MRVTTQMFYNQFLTGIQQTLAAQLKDDNQISSGKTINEPSDNPTVLSQVVDYQTQLSDITAYTNAMNSAKAQLQSVDSALSNLGDTLSSANQLAIEAEGGTTDSASRTMIADQVSNLFETAVSIANTKSGSQYIFAGDQSNVPPINTTTGELTGDTNSFNINISQGISISANVSAGSLFSFKRVNTTDSTTAILPTYNWTNYGANTIPDADPVSALQTTVPSSSIYTINPGDSISINGVSVNLNAGATSAAYDRTDFINKLNTKIAGAGFAGVTVSYDAANNEFQINNAGAAVTVNWQGSPTTATPTASNVEKALGFSAVGDQTIGAGGSIESSNTIGKFTSSGNIFTTNGGAFNVNVGGSTASSLGGFIINGTNNTIVIDGTAYTINNANNNNNDFYTGTQLATALSNLDGGNAIKATYDGTTHKFNITSAGATTVDFGSTAAGTTTIGQILGFNDSNAGTISTGLTSDNAVGDVNLAAGSTLQDVRDAFNASSAGVKAQVVNEGTTANPDFRLVVASNPAGSSSNIDISILSNPRTPTSSIGAGSSITGAPLSFPLVLDSTDNAINFTDNTTGVSHTATIAAGTYATAGALATAMQTAFHTADAAAFPNGTPINAVGNTINMPSSNAITINWSNGSSTAQPQQLGFGASASADVTGTGIDMLSYDKTTGNNMTLGTNITNYNYITQASANNSIVIDDGTNGGVANNQIVVTVGGTQETATIARGTYTPDQLATAVSNSLHAAAVAVGKTDAYTVAYDVNAQKFTIAGDSSNADVTTLNWSNSTSTARQLLGYNTTDESAGLTIGAGSNTIVFNDTAGGPYTATVASGTYTSGTSLAAAIQSALNNTAATGSAVNNFVVNYDQTTNKFNISTATADAGLAINWTGAGHGTLNEAQVGFSVAASSVTTNPATATSSSSVSFNGQSDNSVLANYYNFNNNYLNGNNILRALNFMNVSLQNNDSGRIGQAIQYTNSLSDVVSEKRADVGSRENEITAVSNYQADVQTDTTNSMSNAQDTDIAKVSSDVSQQQATLQALLTLSATVLQQNLFSFLK